MTVCHHLLHATLSIILQINFQFAMYVIWKNYILKIMQTENKFIVKMTQHFRRIFLLHCILSNYF